MNKKVDWVHCPYCDDGGTVFITVSYSNEVKFICADCEAETSKGYELQWSKSEVKRYKETGELPENYKDT